MKITAITTAELSDKDLAERLAPISGMRCRGCGANPLMRDPDTMFYLAELASWCAECAADRYGELPNADFALANDPPARPRLPIPDVAKTTQRMLLDGLDCLPGQIDLFDTGDCQ